MNSGLGGPSLESSELMLPAVGYGALGGLGMLMFSLILRGVLWLYDGVARRGDSGSLFSC
jgi:hypothetical protein